MPPAHVFRILDASLNRAGEGLRVVEDYVRFVLDDPFLTSQAKSLRHDFGDLAGRISPADRHAARDTLRDVGTQISTETESFRDTAWDVCAASLKRTEQSLRSLEEYGKLVDPELARQAESLRYRAYTLEKAIEVGRSSRDRLEGVQLCVLVDGCGSEAAFKRTVLELVAAGVGMIQLRDKKLDDRELLARARLLVSLTRRHAVAHRQPPAPPTLITRNQPPAPPGVSAEIDTCTEKPPAEPGADKCARSSTLAIINDRADIAATVHADGVHLGQEDLSVKDARAIVGTQMLIGISTHNIQQARAAVLDGANYLGAGPTFPSSTKSFDAFAGLDYLREVVGEIRLPTFAIGGITAQNLCDVISSGISRVAVGAAATQAENSSVAMQALLSILNEAGATPAPAEPNSCK